MRKKYQYLVLALLVMLSSCNGKFGSGLFIAPLLPLLGGLWFLWMAINGKDKKLNSRIGVGLVIFGTIVYFAIKYDWVDFLS